MEGVAPDDAAVAAAVAAGAPPADTKFRNPRLGAADVPSELPSPRFEEPPSAEVLEFSAYALYIFTCASESSTLSSCDRSQLRDSSLAASVSAVRGTKPELETTRGASEDAAPPTFDKN